MNSQNKYILSRQEFKLNPFKAICRSTFIRHEFLQTVNLRNNENLHPSLRKKFCLHGGGDCEGTLLAMQRLLLIYGENC